MARQFASGVSADQIAATASQPGAAASAFAPGQHSLTASDAASALDLSGARGDYPGDHASQEEIAKWMARKAQEAGLPPELPVMASLVESGLKNLDYGDASSVGYFQMLTTIWDKPGTKYAGYLQDPQKQVQWFIDHALAVKQDRLARGLPVDDPSQYGDWVADVERPLEAYRGRYQLRLDQARKLLGA
jgi:hypothetical protein